MADVVATAMQLRGGGVLAFGRCDTPIKHAIKRVWRFFRNEEVEVESIQPALVNHLRPPKGKPCVVLVDYPLQDLGRLSNY